MTMTVWIYLRGVFMGFGLTLSLSTLANEALDRLYGPQNPERYQTIETELSDPSRWQQAQSVFESRCVACHACWDAPCQLKLGSYEGLTRGGSDAKVYDAVRVFPAKPTRLFMDADRNPEWRQMGFSPVLNERSKSSEADLSGSLLYRMLDLKNDHAFPSSGLLPSDRYDFGVDRKQECSTLDEFQAFKEDHPEWGMPYGLPPLKDLEQRTLINWLSRGAIGQKRVTQISDAAYAEIAQWEAFLNDQSPKGQLSGRYIYEHWFLAHLYFEDQPLGTYFELVRSKTPPGKPIDLIRTRLPYDDPGTFKVYYRFRPLQEALTAKTHMPYPLNAAKLKRYQQSFLEANYAVKTLPSYLPEVASNPFKVFAQLPMRARYRFLLDEAQFTIMTFIKGPVCRGQVAVDVIQDHFWVVFVDPDSKAVDSNVHESMLQNLRLPNESESFVSPISSWVAYSAAETAYIKAKADYANRHLKEQDRPTLDILWDGDGYQNTNAVLTVFRHFDSASVVKGLVGDRPESVWVMGYPLLERIYYLLVAGFDVFGNTIHQLDSRLYMDFLRMEAESNFLMVLPKDKRDEVADFWYRGARSEVRDYVNGGLNRYNQDTGVTFHTQHPYPEMVGMLKDRYARLDNAQYDLEKGGFNAEELANLKTLRDLHGRAVSFLPEVSFVTFESLEGKPRYFTILRNSAHSNVAEMFDEENRRLPDEDTLTVVNGFIGAYPNAFIHLRSSEMKDFINRIKTFATSEDYDAFSEWYVIRRTNPNFWVNSDQVNAAYRERAPIEAGWFDYNRLENR